MNWLDNFKFDDSTTIEINDGVINKIIVENKKTKGFVKMENNTLELPTHGNAIIEFSNGKRMLVTNSEWCSFNWL
jgi:hypothetical protein